MKTSTLVLLLILCSGCGGGSLPLTPSASIPAKAPGIPASYNLRDLAPLAGGGAAQAQAVNSLGDVVGYSNFGTTPHATLWRAEGTTWDLGGLVAEAINSTGLIAGYAVDSGGHAQPCLWRDAITGPQLLGSIAGYDSSLALGVNDAGEVVGVAYLFAQPSHQIGFTWTSSAGMKPIPGSAAAQAIAGSTIVGINTASHAATFTSAGASDLGSLGGLSAATALSNDKVPVIVGFAQLASGVSHPVIFGGKRITDLGVLTPGDSSVAIGTSGSLIVGTEITSAVASARASWQSRMAHDLAAGQGRAWVWSQRDGMRDLNSLVNAPGWDLVSTEGMNSQGMIVGAGAVSGYVHGFVLTPGK